MNGKYLLDSNIIIAIFNGDQSVIDRVKMASEIYVPSIVVGELYYGAFNSSRKEANIDRIDYLRDEVIILNCDDYTAKFYGQIKKGLKDKGTPIPENDIWIAAIAVQHALTVATRDIHFRHAPGLTIEKW